MLLDKVSMLCTTSGGRNRIGWTCMSYKYVIDSSAWVEYIGGTKRAEKIKAIIEKEMTATSIIAIAELADKFTRENKRFELLLKFIQSRSLIIPLTINIAIEAATIKKELRAKAPKFGLVDAIHLATAKLEGAIFITVDNYFAGAEKVVII